MASKSAKSVKPALVRTWADSQGLTTGKRGKFSDALIKSYNAANPKAQYRPGVFVPTHLVTAKRQGKPPVRKTVNATQARAILTAAGVNVPARGRLSNEHLRAYVLLGR